MRQALKLLRNCISYIFIAVILWIIVSVLFFDGSDVSINNKAPIAMSVVALILLGIILHSTLHMFEGSNTRRTWIIFGVIAGFIIVFTALFLRTRLDLQWDPGRIYIAVYNKINGISGDWLGYYRSFPFQFFILCFYYTICKIVLAVLPFLSVGAVMYITNCVLVAISVLLYVMTLCRLLGNTYTSKLMSYSFIFATSVLLYTAVVYTDTASMVAVSGMLYLASIIYTRKKRNLWLYPILGCLALLGFLIKASAAIFLIAFLITLWLDKETFGSKIIATLLILVPFMIGEMAWTSFSSKYTESDRGVPKIHWVMMGLTGYGGFNKEDYVLTENALGDNKSVNEVCGKEITRRLKSYGPIEYLKFLSRKISYTWGDGTYYISKKLARSPRNTNNLISDIFREGGKYNKIYEWIADILHLTMLFLLLIGAFMTRKDNNNIMLICKLAIIGVFTFFLFWETRSRYLLNYTPVIYVLSGLFVWEIVCRLRQDRLRVSYVLSACALANLEKVQVNRNLRSDT